MREATLTTQELQSLTSEDGLLTNMLISGDTQGIAQLITSVSMILDNLAVQEKPNQSTSTGGDGEDGEAKKARMEVGKDHGTFRSSIDSSPPCNVKAWIFFNGNNVCGSK